MTAEPDLLPCPFCGGQVFIHHGHRDIGYVTCGQRDDGSDGCGVVASFRPNKGGREAIAAWNRRANVAHATAAKDAEIEALRAEVERLDAIVQNREAIIGTHAADTRQYQQHIMRAEARAERLAEALREMREYVTAALQDQREAFAGHEDSSDIPGIEADLHKIDTLLREQENDDA